MSSFGLVITRTLSGPAPVMHERSTSASDDDMASPPYVRLELIRRKEANKNLKFV